MTPGQAPDGRTEPDRTAVGEVARTPDGRPAMPLPAHVRESLQAVLAGLRLPARRWQVIAEGDAWGISGALRRALNLLPECTYPTLDAIADTLLHGGVLNARPPGGTPVRPDVASRAA